MTVVQFPGNPKPSYFRGDGLVLILPVIRIEWHEERDLPESINCRCSVVRIEIKESSDETTV